MTRAPRRRRAAALPLLAALSLPALAAVAGCSAAQDAVSSASTSVQQQAQQKAQEVAVQAFTSQVCALTEDGKLSSADVERLRSGLDAARAAGLPEQVVSTLQPLVEQGRAASAAQVKKIRAQNCG